MSPNKPSKAGEPEQDEKATDVAVDESAEGEEEKPKLNLDVKIWTKSACERHITVTVPREDIERYFDDAFSELMDKAAVPGFRAGRAPRKLVESRFRKDIADQVRGSLLMDSMGQVAEDHELSPISEPNFDPLAVKLPEKGPMTFEFDIEVRPDFDLPPWRGLRIERPVRDFTEADIDKQLQKLLANKGRLVPFEGSAKMGDYLSLNLSFKEGDKVLQSVTEEIIRIRPVLSFRDGNIENFDKLMIGVKAGETRETKVSITPSTAVGMEQPKDITAVFEVLEVKKLELPELTPQFLKDLGDFESVDELREAIKHSLERRLDYHRQQLARKQVTAALTVAANWELPPELLKRQARRELERSILELRRSGFGEQEIRQHANELRQNSMEGTAKALKEHFILERLAEEEKIEESADDYDEEIRLIAQQSGESPRRVRAQLEKKQLMDALRNQIIERKAIDLILSHATFQDTPYEPDELADSEAIDQSAGGEQEPDDLIPEAQYAGEPTSLLEDQNKRTS